MISSTKAKAAKKKKVRGRPFVKGDPRINRDRGPKCEGAAAYSLNAINALAKKLSPDEWADIVADKARRGHPWAVQLYADLLIEKQPQQQNVNVTGAPKLIVEVVMVRADDSGNGNGNGHK